MTNIPQLPAGFVLDDTPPLPEGFVLDAAPQTEADTAPALNLESEIKGIIGAGAAASPMNDPAALDDPLMRDAGSNTWGDVARDYATGAGNLVNFGARGVADGLTSLATLPQAVGELWGSALSGGARALGAPDAVADAIGGASILQYLPSKAGVDAVGDSVNAGIADALGVEPPREARTMPERFAQRVGQEIGPAMVPAAGLAAKYGNTGLEAAQGASSLARFFGAEAAAVNAPKFLQREAAMATAAGSGAAALNPNGDSPLLDMAGAVGGAGIYGVGTAVGSSVADIGRAFFGKGSFQDEVVREAVMRDIAAAAGVEAKPGDAPDLTAIINGASNSPRVGDTIPGYQESLADRTKNPGLAALEYSRQSGPNSGAYAAQRANNTRAIDDAMQPLEPQATPGQFSGALEAERSGQLLAAGERTTAAQTAFDDATRSLMPALTAEGRGANIRTALQDASEEAKKMLNEAWAPINNSNQPVDMSALGKSFGDIDSGLSTAETQRFRPTEADIPNQLVEPGAPAQPTGILDATGNPIMRPEQAANGQQPLSEITGIRSALTDAQREAASAGRNNEARIIGQYIDSIDGYMANNLPDELRGQYDTARSATRDFNDRFNRPQTAIGQTLAEREGMPRHPYSSVAGKFVQSDQGRIADFESLMKEAGNDARVQTAVRDQVLQDVRDRGLMDNPTALNDYLGQYGKVFEKFPDLKNELGNAGALRTQLKEAADAEKQLSDMLTKQNKSSVANYLSYGDEKATQAMKGVLASRDPKASINELMDFVGDQPKAVEGARRVFWDLMQERSRSGGRTTADINGTQPWSPKALSDFLENPTNQAVAERLYKDAPEHLANVKSIAEVLKGVDTRNAAKAPNTSGTAQGVQSNLLTPEAVQSRMYAYMSGRISGTFLATSFISVLVRRGVRKAQEQGYQRMMDDILTNADTAALLMKENNPANRQALAKKAKGWYGAEASSFINSMSADDKDSDKDAIMRGAK